MGLKVWLVEKQRIKNPAAYTLNACIYLYVHLYSLVPKNNEDLIISPKENWPGEKTEKVYNCKANSVYRKKIHRPISPWRSI